MRDIITNRINKECLKQLFLISVLKKLLHNKILLEKELPLSLHKDQKLKYKRNKEKDMRQILMINSFLTDKNAIIVKDISLQINFNIIKTFVHLSCTKRIKISVQVMNIK